MIVFFFAQFHRAGEVQYSVIAMLLYIVHTHKRNAMDASLQVALLK